MKKRIWAMLLCLTLIFSSSNVAFAAENLGNEVAEKQVVETVEDTKAAASTITLHFKNTKNWSEIALYSWSDISNESDLSGIKGWPGVVLKKDEDHPTWYTAVIETTSNPFNYIINNNDKGVQTVDLKITDGTCEKWIELSDQSDKKWNVNYLSKPADWDEEHVNSPVISDNKVIFSYRDTNEAIASVYLAGDMNGWSSTANQMTLNPETSVYSCELSLAPGTYQYKFVVNYNDNQAWYLDPSNERTENDKEGKPNSLCIVSGYKDVGVIDVGRGSETPIPSRLNYLDPNGNTNSVSVTYEKIAGNENDEFVIDNKKKTLKVPASYEGNTYQLKATTEAGFSGIITVSVVDKEDVFASPIINGNQITFMYKDTNTNTYIESVHVAGTMNGWSATEDKMTYDSEKGVYSCTMTINPGRYEYKFVIKYSNNPENPSWIIDPKNTSIKAESETNANSVLTVESDGTVEGKNKITVNIYYSGRKDNVYTDWNGWIWADTMGGQQYNFKEEGGKRYITVEVDNARANNSLSYIIRKGDWKEKEFDTRSIDLSAIVSGTVNCYVTSGVEVTKITSESDVVTGVKVKKAEYIRSNNTIEVTTVLPIFANNLASVFTLKRTTGETLTITDVAHEEIGVEHKYILSLKDNLGNLENVVKGYTLTYDGYSYQVTMPNVYATEEFENAYTYTGDDLGATWTKEKTTFKVWAPTADKVVLNLYKSGTAPKTEAELNKEKLEAPYTGQDKDKAEFQADLTETPFKTVQMTKGDKGVWSAVEIGDLNGTYYTYSVTVDGKTTEACDPYARTTGVNGKRAMVINLDSTDPEGWDEDVNPNYGMDQTDAIIYELHVRDLTNDADSGTTAANKGKFLGVTETGTTNGNGQATGLDHIIDLGVTHIHFLPIYDYGSVDESKLSKAQFNWGYDPVNYNVPEGSYSTDPYNGEVRVKELKEMVQTLHENNINVIMDVVYNHVYDSGAFSFNQIVPDYFSRTSEDGSYSNTSGCGNDTASEREMVRKYIVESVVYWAEEYHFDGFRFDLVGLIDVETINKIVEEVHKINPSIVFYGEGWNMDGTLMNPHQDLAKQENAGKTPKFGYFSDTIRDKLKGKNTEKEDDGDFLGYVNGNSGLVGEIESAVKGMTWWSKNPSQIVNYASCHDNYTLKDKINVSTKNDSEENRIKMNNLSAAIYMMAEGIPLIHAGEEMLRTKVDADGTIIHNSYNASDAVNNIDWSDLNEESYQKVVDYYAGLIEFRKNHEALRLDTEEQVNTYVSSWIIRENNVVLFKYRGDVPGEISDGIVVILNPNKTATTFNMYDCGVTNGDWQVCIDDEKAGIEVLKTIKDGKVTVDPISVLVLVKGETVDTKSVYINNGYVPSVKADTIVVEERSVELSKTDVKLKKGETVKLTATVKPNNATVKAVTWASSNTKVATVAIDGTVTAVADGTATITATTSLGKTATCTITVTTPAVEPEKPAVVEVTSITLNKTAVELKKGDTFALTATVKPDNATDKKVTWTTSNTKVATVDANGKVTAVADGTATITATAGTAKAICAITVKTPAPAPTTVDVTSITLDQNTATLKKGETVTLKATVNPSNATDKTVTWTTSDTKVATVDNAGKVTAVADGTAVITAKAGNKTATCTITVKTPAPEPEKPTEVPVTSVTLNKKTANLVVGKTLTLKATVTPKNATNQKLTWKSSNTKVATVDKNGKVKGVKAGTVTITAATANGKKATCKVTVVKATLNATSLPLQVKKSVTLTATSTLKGDKVKSWKSSNTKVAKVDKKGKVTATSKTGKVTITVTMKSGATATCTVKVQKGAVTTKKLTLNKTKATLKVKQKLTLKVTRNPISATDKITWKSSNPKVATVDKNGKVTAKKAGKVTITAKVGKKSVKCTITVKKK